MMESASMGKTMRVELLGKSGEELRALMVSLGERAYRGAQICHALYAERRFDFTTMSNLPAALRARLAAEASITPPRITKRYHSTDGSVRYLLAQLGLVRNLSAGEIAGQVLVALEDNRAKLAPQTNVVLMGQGEPLLNYEPVIAALRLLLDPNGVGLSPKHVTLSTSGIVPGIERLAAEKLRPKLAVSLNASSDEQRNAIMPINRKYPLSALLDACRRYALRPWEHLTFEYVLLGGFNDRGDDARRVVKLIANLRAKVNLIPWNPGELPYQAPQPERIEEFRRILTEKGVPTFVRYSRGQDIMAACGQLALLETPALLHNSQASA